MTAEQADIALLDSLPAYTTDSIESRLAVDSTLIRLDIYRWYADGYRYPMVETRIRRDVNEDEALTAAAYYFPPSALATITNDPDNEEVRAWARYGTQWHGNSNETDEKSSNSKDNAAYNNTDGNHGEKTTVYDLYGISGRRVHSSQNTRNGVYLKEQHQGSKRQAEKVTIKK